MFEGFYVVVEDNDLWLYATEAGDDEGYPVRNLGEVVPVTEVIGAIWEHKNEKEKPRWTTRAPGRNSPAAGCGTPRLVSLASSFFGPRVSRTTTR